MNAHFSKRFALAPITTIEYKTYISDFAVIYFDTRSHAEARPPITHIPVRIKIGNLLEMSDKSMIVRIMPSGEMKRANARIVAQISSQCDNQSMRLCALSYTTSLRSTFETFFFCFVLFWSGTFCLLEILVCDAELAEQLEY